MLRECFKALIWCMGYITHASGGTHKPQMHHTMCRPNITMEPISSQSQHHGVASSAWQVR